MPNADSNATSASSFLMRISLAENPRSGLAPRAYTNRQGSPALDFTTNPDRFSGFVRQHQAMVVSLARRLLGDEDDAEEVAQEVFCKLFQHGAELESERHVLFWLRQVATRQALDRCRRRKLRPRVGLEDAPEPSVLPHACDPWRAQALRAAVASLPARQRAVVVLRYQEDLDPAEIARVLRRPLFTVKSQLQRALRRLRTALDALPAERTPVS